MCVSMGTTLFAVTPEDKLTPEQEAVISNYDTKVITKTEGVQGNNARASRAGYRVSLYRGTFLMWTEDFVEWNTDGRSITSSTAWQNAGFVFPNIARAKGIYKHYVTPTQVVYRADKSIGAGTVTPWGDFHVYESNLSDFIAVNANGTYSWW